MYILHATADMELRDSGLALLHLIDRRDPKQFCMKVLLPEGSRLLPELKARGIEAVTLPIRGNRPLCLRDLPRLIRCLRRERPDILHTHGYTGARLAGALSGVRTLISTQHRPAGRTTRMYRLFRFLYRGFTTFTVTTTEEAQRALAQKGIRPDLTAVISDGVPPIPRLSAEEKRRVRARLGIPESAFVIGVLSPLSAEMRPELLLLAADELRRRDACFRILFIGDGERRPQLIRLAERMGLSELVLFPSPFADRDMLCNILDVTASGAGNATLPIAGAMSLAVPAVLSETEENAAFLENGRGGILFPPENYGALAALLDRLRRCPWERTLLSISAERRYRSHFSANEMYRAYESLYLSLHRG